MSGWRRFLYLLVDNSVNGTYPLRRIDGASLFSSTKAGVFSSTRTLMDKSGLPEPFISFTPERAKFGSANLNFFTLFGPGEKSLIAGADTEGSTFVYDLDKHLLHNQVRLNEPKLYSPISLSVGDALYVMDKRPLPRGRFGFEALTYDQVEVEGQSTTAWRWRCLKPPPYILAPSRVPDPNLFHPNSTCIRSYTAVGSRIWISTPGIGTYSFDTVTASWVKAGDWELPFSGRAQYIPEYGLWLGFSDVDNMLCSSNLNTASAQIGPVLIDKWEDLDGLDADKRKDLVLTKSHLVHLASGRFCLARFYHTQFIDPSEHGRISAHIDSFIVLTGLTLEQNLKGFEMKKHGSQVFEFGALIQGWVF